MFDFKLRDASTNRLVPNCAIALPLTDAIKCYFVTSSQVISDRKHCAAVIVFMNYENLKVSDERIQHKCIMQAVMGHYQAIWFEY